MTSDQNNPIQTADVLHKATGLCGDEARATAWLGQPLPGFGCTPAELIAEGHGSLVMRDLDRQAEGVYS